MKIGNYFLKPFFFNLSSQMPIRLLFHPNKPLCASHKNGCWRSAYDIAIEKKMFFFLKKEFPILSYLAFICFFNFYFGLQMKTDELSQMGRRVRKQRINMRHNYNVRSRESEPASRTASRTSGRVSRPVRYPNKEFEVSVPLLHQWMVSRCCIAYVPMLFYII